MNCAFIAIKSPSKGALIMLSGVVLVLLVLVFALLLLRFFLIHKERKLGYPKADENFDDVKLLLL
jgi:hypothetical protein